MRLGYRVFSTAAAAYCSDAPQLVAEFGPSQPECVELVAADVAWEEHDLVFCWFDGRPIHMKQPTRCFREHIQAAGLPAIRLHDVRHTCASIALVFGVPITVVSRRLGHVSISITLDVYGHCLPADDRDTASRTAALILGVRDAG